MRLRHLIVLATIAVCVLGAINILVSEEAILEMEKKGEIVINGNRTGMFWYTLKENNEVVLLPIADILDEIGVSIEWSSPQKAVITIQEMQFVLDAQAGTLLAEDEGIDLFVPTPDSAFGKHHCVMNDTLFIDSDSCMFLLYNVLHTYIDIDPLGETMYIVNTID